MLCQALDDLPEAKAGTPIGNVQRAFREGDVHKAIRVLGAFLESNGLDFRARKYPVDPLAFKYQRLRKRLTQESLATSLGVKTPQISHVEQGRNSLSLPRILLALSAFDVSADEIFNRDVHRTEPALTDKVSRLHAMNKRKPHMP